ncbi:MAG: hypothetical protein LBE08_02245 [Bifidobacteriaceae bacterium]|jgi:hypothetical protein|nr:hypothetical protein [Bifidobacteriaceae bacterium]
MTSPLTDAPAPAEVLVLKIAATICRLAELKALEVDRQACPGRDDRPASLDDALVAHQIAVMSRDTTERIEALSEALTRWLTSPVQDQKESS